MPNKPSNQVYKRKIDSQIEELHLRNLLASNKIGELLNTLNKVANTVSNDFDRNIVLLTARYNANKEKIRTHTVSTDITDREYNRIRLALYEYIENIPQQRALQNIIDGYANDTIAHAHFLEIPTNVQERIEKVIGKESIYEIDWIEKAWAASKAVCCIELPNGDKGTGFLLKGGYLLTNNHVIPEQLSNARIAFNYKKDGEITYRELESDVFYYSPEEELDYTLVKVKGDISEWGYLQIEDWEEPQKGNLCNIIQHPEGTTKKIAAPDEIIKIDNDNNKLYYKVDTKEGSSGSPVFNQDWKVIGLHRASTDLPKADDTEQKQGANVGTLITAIIEHLKKQDFDTDTILG